MSYFIDFQGQFNLTPKLTPDQVGYLTRFSETRRMKRNAQIAEELPDPARKAVGLDIGIEAEYFVGFDGYIYVGTTAYMRQDWDCRSVVHINEPPSTQPNLRCGWIPTEDGNFIEWDGTEKFEDYLEWMEYLIKHFLLRWGITANGCINLKGEDGDDMGKITVVNNTITTNNYY